MATSRVGMLGMRQLQQSLRRAATPPSMFRQSSIILTRTQLFSTSPVKQIFPPGPQKVRGGVNDPAPVPAPSPSHGSYHWIAERGISVAIIPLTLIPFAAGSLNPVVDAVLVSLMLLHSHLGFQSCVTDYFPIWKMAGARKAMEWILLLSTIGVGIGFYEFETNDVGVTEAIKRIWKAGSANDATVGKVSTDALGYDAKHGNLKA